MRFFNNHASAATTAKAMPFEGLASAATTAKAMPFEGLGFAMDAVQAAAQVMTLGYRCRKDSTGVTLPVPNFVAQPSGYSLLVTLGREIRGR